ncbi:TetR/AcrR family transcriptional regulator [Ancylobacter sp. IITR112]|uniref:TetR/AcrR family transcriptional regulator n=1 Tax=Ancylobacter sp. IITR112 TaxID=3138073 RepID=UPI00352A8967
MASLPDFAHQSSTRHARGGTEGDTGPGATPPSPSAAKHDQILRGAREVFLASGFDGASMGEIARAAGVSKGTLYVYFGSKEDLFTALVTDECTRTAEACFELDPDGPTEATLRTLASHYIEAMLEPGHVRTVRMVIGVAEKLPAIGRAFLQAGQEAGVQRLSDWLRAKTMRGELVIDDVEMAAWQFVLGCQGKLIMPMVFGDPSHPDETAIAQVVDHMVHAFLAAFARRGTESHQPEPAEADAAASAASPSR